jgi:hypothetical protein
VMYFWLLAVLFASATVLSVIRWEDDYHLFVLGLLSFVSAMFGRSAARWHWPRWPRLHLTGMGSSYILMLTAFLVDNGKFLPLWRELPPLALWFIPGVLGLPFLVHALLRHPVAVGYDRLRSARSISSWCVIASRLVAWTARPPMVQALTGSGRSPLTVPRLADLCTSAPRGARASREIFQHDTIGTGDRQRRTSRSV